jgi:CO/xanthine dehydrogenase Mo-binding subunit
VLFISSVYRRARIVPWVPESISFLCTYPSPVNPLGATGAGEGGIIPVDGVIANAVASALASLGIEPRELPLTPARVRNKIPAANRVDEGALARKVS